MIVRGLILWAFLAVLPAQAVIYEEDSRQDIYEIDERSPVRFVSDSIAAVVTQSELGWNLSGRFLPENLRTLQERKRVCSDVRYSEQLTMGFCTSFLVAPDKMITARHCLSAAPCTFMRFAFDFSITEDHSTGGFGLSASEVYRCKSYSYPRDELGPTYDFAVVELDRPVVGREPLPLRGRLSPDDGATLYTVGHPNGLPQKVASGGSINEKHDSYFLAKLDTFHGNSGSPVLNEQTHEVEGVLIDGESDYENRGGCRVPRVCNGEECKGETVLDISHVLEFLSK